MGDAFDFVSIASQSGETAWSAITIMLALLAVAFLRSQQQAQNKQQDIQQQQAQSLLDIGDTFLKRLNEQHVANTKASEVLTAQVRKLQGRVETLLEDQTVSVKNFAELRVAYERRIGDLEIRINTLEQETLLANLLREKAELEVQTYDKISSEIRRIHNALDQIDNRLRVEPFTITPLVEKEKKEKKDEESNTTD
jgi:hypothetical protein